MSKNIVPSLSLEVQNIEGSLLVDSRLIANRLGIEHEHWELILCETFFGEIPVYLTLWDCLAICRVDSLNAFSIKGDLLVLAEKIFYPYLNRKDRGTFAWLKLAVCEGIAHDHLCRSSESGRVQNWFSQNYMDIFPGSQLVKVYSNERKRPDHLIKIDDIVIPVECKLVFDKKAEKQLRKYMKLWNVDRGIAVAPRFTVAEMTGICNVLCP